MIIETGCELEFIISAVLKEDRKSLEFEYGDRTFYIKATHDTVYVIVDVGFPSEDTITLLESDRDANIADKVYTVIKNYLDEN